MSVSKKYLIVIGGPTAVGKTELAISMANFFSTEIISADSRQFFREMDIGTAKPDAGQLSRAVHHFVDFLPPEQEYSAGTFATDALLKLQELFKKHQVVIMVGGSGLYLRAVTDGLNEFPDIPPAIRSGLADLHARNGINSLREKLLEIDPEYYKQVDLSNPQRLIRALEVSIHTGKPYSSFRIQKPPARDFEVIRIGLDLPRTELYDRINKRVDKMMEEGLLDEVRSLFEKRHLNALNTVGYKELFQYLEGGLPLEEAVEKIKQNTRRFAKRQLTWFRAEEGMVWYHPAAEKKILEDILLQIKQS